MSKIYARISESARKTIATARAHKAATVDVATHLHRIETRIVKSDVENEFTFEITLVGLDSGMRCCLSAGTLGGNYVCLDVSAPTGLSTRIVNPIK